EHADVLSEVEQVVCLIGRVGEIPQKRYERSLMNTLNCQFSAAGDAAVVLSQSTEQLSHHRQREQLPTVHFDDQHARFTRACPQIGGSGAVESSIHRRSAKLELTDAPLCPA